MPRSRFLLFLLLSSLCVAANTHEPSPSLVPFPLTAAPKPLYRDPIHDGAADPVVVWNPHVQRWWMFYTNRRANVPNLSGVAWIHGTHIGIAESADDGTTWSHLGIAEIDLPTSLASKNPTFWAPHILSVPEPECNLLGYTSTSAHSPGAGVTHHIPTLNPSISAAAPSRSSNSTSPTADSPATATPPHSSAYPRRLPP